MLRAIWFVSASVFLISFAGKDAASGEIRDLRQQSLAAPGAVTMLALFESGAATQDACATASQAAERLEREGKLLAARAGLAACLVPGCPERVIDECGRRVAAIDAALPAVVLVAQDEASHNLTDVRVSMDGRALVDRLDGIPISVDPGEHRFAFVAVGFRGIETTVVARQRNKRIRVVAFLSAAETSEAGGAPTISHAAGASVEPAGPAFTRGWKRKVGLGLGGAGVASLAIGTIWAFKAKTTYDHALSSECDGDLNRCSSQGVEDGHTAHHQATVATVGFAAAGVLLAAAAAVYFTAPTETRIAVAPTVADGNGGSLTVMGRW